MIFKHYLSFSCTFIAQLIQKQILNLKEIIKNISGLPETRSEQLLSIAQSKKLLKNEYFITEGQIPRKFCFALSGLFRYVYIDKEGNEYTKAIIPENNFISSYSAMIKDTPSYFFIQALEDAEILEINYRDWLSLKKSDPFWDGYLVTQLEKAYCIKEKRERDLLLLDAETRYLDFLEVFPLLENRVRLHMVASYLGIKPESLSRIRKKLMT